MIDYDTTTSDFQKMKLKGQQEHFHFDGSDVAMFPFLPATMALDDDSNQMTTASMIRPGFAASTGTSSCHNKALRFLEHQQSSDTVSTAVSSQHDDQDDPMTLVMEPLDTANQAPLALHHQHHEERCHPNLGVCSSLKRRSRNNTHHHHHHHMSLKGGHYDDDCDNKMNRKYLDDFPIIEWTEDEDLPPFKNSKSLNAIHGIDAMSASRLSALLTPRTSSCANEGLVRSKSFGSQLDSLHIIQRPIR